MRPGAGDRPGPAGALPVARGVRGAPADHSAIRSALYVIGDVDYELWLECDSFAGLGDALTQICGFPGVAVESTSLVLHEVTGLRLRRPAVADGVTKRRLRSM